MAEMFPQELLADEVKSNGERKVVEALCDELSAPCQAYRSVSWVARDHAKGAIDGEINFVKLLPASSESLRRTAYPASATPPVISTRRRRLIAESR